MHKLIQTEVSHQRGDHSVLPQLTDPEQKGPSDSQNLISIERIATFITEQQPVCIAVVRQPKVRLRLPDKVRQGVRVSAATAGIDIVPVRSGIPQVDLGPQSGKCQWS